MKNRHENLHDEGDQISGQIYHVTPTRNLDSIIREGLRPMIGPRSVLIGEVTEKVYFFGTMHAVEGALSNWLGEELDKEPGAISVLAVDHSGLHLSSGAGYELACLHLVPPEKISLAFEDQPPASKKNQQVTKGTA